MAGSEREEGGEGDERRFASDAERAKKSERERATKK
jgi:hypothetical protein